MPRRTLLLALVSLPSILPGLPAAAQSYDIDCKLILCLAGGFPSSCADAKAYMIDRITSVPPKPPIGFCAMSDGSEYTDYHLDYAWVSPASAEGWVCPEGKLKYFRASREERGETHVQVFCYDERVVVRAGWRDEEPTYAWLGRSWSSSYSPFNGWLLDFRMAIKRSPKKSAWPRCPCKLIRCANWSRTCLSHRLIAPFT